MSATYMTPSGRWVRSITSPTDQQKCNSCWAIATCQAMSDQLRIRGSIRASDQLNFYAFYNYMHDHDPGLGSCEQGAYDDTGRIESVQTGAPLMSDAHDSEFGVHELPGDQYLYHYRASGWNQLHTPQEIKNELDYNGSVTAIINLYDSWYDFMGMGPYIPGPGEQTSGEQHMVSIVGYDDRDGTFIIRNSYGQDWGWNGFVKIKQTDKKLDVLSNVYAPII